jgi:hypothetical protein
MKQFLKDYLTEMGKLTMHLIDVITFAMLAGVGFFVAFYVFATLYGWAK